MKLVEILAKHVSEWPEDTAYAYQDPSGTIYCTSKGKPKYNVSWRAWDVSSSSIVMSANKSIYGVTLDVASDHDKSVIDRSQWQAERDRQKGGEWKRHRGGKQPVADDVVVEYKLRNGYTDTWHARALIWIHAGGEGDVMKYRVISQPQAEEVEVKDTTIGTLSYKVEIDKTEATQAIDELAAKWDQIETPFKWRDEITELNAYIEKYTRERDALIERLASEGFALIPPVVSVVSEFSGAGMIFPIEEWQIGDIVEVVSVSDESSAPLGVFKITDIDASEPKYELDDKYFPNHEQMKFIRRP